MTPKTTLVNVLGAEVAVKHLGEKEPRIGKQRRRQKVLDSDLVNVATDQAEKVQGNVQPGRDVRMEKEEEKRLDADDPEGSAKKTHP